MANLIEIPLLSKETASCKIAVNGRTARRSDNIMPSPSVVQRRHNRQLQLVLLDAISCSAETSAVVNGSTHKISVNLPIHTIQ